MSQLNFTTISNLSGTSMVTTENIIAGSAKAWVYFTGNATPINIRSSHNINSITDRGTGYYQVDFGIDMGDSNYCYIQRGNQVMRSNYGPMGMGQYGGATETTRVRMLFAFTRSDGVAQDGIYYSVILFGNGV